MDRGTEPDSADGVITRRAGSSAAGILLRLEAEIARRGLTVFARYDHAENARSVGLDMRPATVLVFGSPLAGTPLMQARPLIALELPLRVLVWEDETGDVFVSHPDRVALAARYGLPADLAGPLAGVTTLVEAALAS